MSVSERITDALHQTVVAVLDLFGELRLVVVAAVGEARTVEHQVGIDERLRERPAGPVRSRGELPRRGVEPQQLLAELVGEDDLLIVDLLAGEELAPLGFQIGRAVHERIGALVHQRLARRNGLPKPALGRGFQPQFRVVLAVGTLIEADTGFQGQRHHDELAAVASLVELLLVLGVDGFVVPGHRAEGLDLRVVEPGPPEASHALVVFHLRVVVHVRSRLRKARQEVVDVVDVRPVADIPAGLFLGTPLRFEEIRGAVYGHQIGILVPVGQRRVARHVLLQQSVDEEHHILLRTEERIGSHLRKGLALEKVGARRQSEGRQHQQRYDFAVFHDLVRIRK